MKKYLTYKISKTKILLITTVLIFGGFFCGFSQQSEGVFQEIDSVAKKMFVDATDKNYDAIMDMVYPKVFEIVPKEIVKEAYKSMFEGNEEVSINLPEKLPCYTVSKVYNDSINHGFYVFVSYDMEMDMMYHNQEFKDDEKELVKTMMKSQGMDVEFLSDNILKAQMKDRITILLKDDFTENKWTMINYDPDSPLLYQVLPSNLLINAKQYRQELLLKNKKANETN